jgi:hypothetical protein
MLKELSKANVGIDLMPLLSKKGISNMNDKSYVNIAYKLRKKTKDR